MIAPTGGPKNKGLIPPKILPKAGDEPIEKILREGIDGVPERMETANERRRNR